MLLQRVVHCSLLRSDANSWVCELDYECGVVSDTTNTSIDLPGSLVVSVDLDTKSAGPQNLIG